MRLEKLAVFVLLLAGAMALLYAPDTRTARAPRGAGETDLEDTRPPRESAAGRSSAEVAGDVKHVNRVPKLTPEPSEPRHKPQPAPPEYFGPLEIRGRVLDADTSDALPDVVVSFVPGGFEPRTEGERNRFVARTRKDGRFRLARMPRARTYAVRAVGRFRLLRGTVRLADVEADTEVVLRLPGALHYERLECYTTDGEPVDVSIARATAAGAIVASSTWSRGELRRLDGLGFDLLGTPPNVLVHVYAESRPPRFRTDDGDRTRPLELRVPGYRPVVLTTERWPASKWPAGRRVTLEREAALARFRFVLRRPSPPREFTDAVGEAWSGPVLDVVMRAGGTERRLVVSPDRAELTGPAEASFEIRLAGDHDSPVVPYTRTAKGDEVAVEPRLPELGVVALRYEVPEDVDPSRPGVEFQVEKGGKVFPPHRVRPGVVLIGPVPPAEYLIRRIWYSASARRWTSDAKGPLVIDEGFAVMEWR
jgi:hypothetical protein